MAGEVGEVRAEGHRRPGAARALLQTRQGGGQTLGEVRPDEAAPQVHRRGRDRGHHGGSVRQDTEHSESKKQAEGQLEESNVIVRRLLGHLDCNWIIGGKK